jgi:hypothetical protein
VKIETLKCGTAIIGFHGKPVQITQIHQYRENPSSSRYLTIRFSNHSTISASPKHRIDGIPASELHVGDACGAYTVTGIESLQGVSRSYDLLTEDTGYRIAGIPVNSMIEEMLAPLIHIHPQLKNVRFQVLPMLPALTGQSPESLATWLKDAGEPSFRAAQILEWVWKKKVTSIDAMSNLPAALRGQPPFPRLRSGHRLFQRP